MSKQCGRCGIFAGEAKTRGPDRKSGAAAKAEMRHSTTPTRYASSSGRQSYCKTFRSLLCETGELLVHVLALTFGLKAVLALASPAASAILTGALGMDVWCKSAAAPAAPVSCAVRVTAVCGLVRIVLAMEGNMQSPML